MIGRIHKMLPWTAALLPVMLLGQLCLAGARSGSSSEQGNRIESLITALNQGDTDARQRAAIALGNTGDPGAVEPLIRALKDNDYFVRDFAAAALGKIGDPRAVEPLIQALADEHALVRRSAALALGILRARKAVEPLIKILENNDEFLVRRAAAVALGKIGDAAAVDALIRALACDDSYIQGGAASALAQIGEPAIPTLVAALGDSKTGPRIAEVLQDLRWRPTTEQEKAQFEAALKNRHSPAGTESE